jgi:hypothetical protein
MRRRWCRHCGSRLARRNRKELVMTETELRLMARAAIIGDSNQPANENSNPAASRTPYAKQVVDHGKGQALLHVGHGRL